MKTTPQKQATNALIAKESSRAVTSRFLKATHDDVIFPSSIVGFQLVASALTSLPSLLSLFPHRRIFLSGKVQTNGGFLLRVASLAQVLRLRDAAALHMVVVRRAALPLHFTISGENTSRTSRSHQRDTSRRGVKGTSGAAGFHEIHPGARRHCGRGERLGLCWSEESCALPLLCCGLCASEAACCSALHSPPALHSRTY